MAVELCQDVGYLLGTQDFNLLRLDLWRRDYAGNVAEQGLIVDGAS